MGDTVFKSDSPLGELTVHFVQSDEGTIRACGKLLKERVIGFDTETTGLDPFTDKLRLVQFATLSKDVYVIDTWKLTESGKAAVAKVIEAELPVKVGQNIKFDIKFSRLHLEVDLVGKVFDTMIAAQILAFGDIHAGFSLEVITPRFLEAFVSKDEQVSNWAAENLTLSQLRYAALDAYIVLELREVMIPKLLESKQYGIAKIEFECLDAVALMELNGLPIDKERWRLQNETSIKEQREVNLKMQELMASSLPQQSLFDSAPAVKLSSQKDLIHALEQMGVEIPVDKKGAKTTREYMIKPLAQQHEVVKQLIEYRGKAKEVTSYGENILEFVCEKTGRIHANFRQIGAPTGRFACSQPNVQQIPHTEGYRRCFRAPAGKKFIIADYSQIELRILAEFTGDEAFVQAFLDGLDLHRATASRVFNIPIDEVTKKERDPAKNLNFGVVYGIGAKRFAQQSDITQSEAEDILAAYFAAYPTMTGWLSFMAREAVSKKESHTAYGRIAKWQFDPTIKEEVSYTERLGKNMPIQGTSADILKRALKLLHEKIIGICRALGVRLLDSPVKLIQIVHDEIVVEAEEKYAERASKMLKEVMEEAGREVLKRVPCVVEVEIKDEWVKD